MGEWSYWGETAMQWVAPSGDTHVVPSRGPEHIIAQTCWCNPDCVGDYTDEGGHKVWLHQEVQ